MEPMTGIVTAAFGLSLGALFVFGQPNGHPSGSQRSVFAFFSKNEPAHGRTSPCRELVVQGDDGGASGRIGSRPARPADAEVMSK